MRVVVGLMSGSRVNVVVGLMRVVVGLIRVVGLMRVVG